MERSKGRFREESEEKIEAKVGREESEKKGEREENSGKKQR